VSYACGCCCGLFFGLMFGVTLLSFYLVVRLSGARAVFACGLYVAWCVVLGWCGSC